jgi:hypothetical protein
MKRNFVRIHEAGAEDVYEHDHKHGFGVGIIPVQHAHDLIKYDARGILRMMST